MTAKLKSQNIIWLLQSNFVSCNQSKFNKTKKKSAARMLQSPVLNKFMLSGNQYGSCCTQTSLKIAATRAPTGCHILELLRPI